MKTILVSAYSVNPFEGSEGGTGWNIVNELGKENRMIVITRKNNIAAIKQYMEKDIMPHYGNLEFHGYDLPAWAMDLKKRLGERGYVLYFYFWQLFLPLFILTKNFKFDIAHALNFHSDSHPTFLWVLGKPTVWGPIGHHPKVPEGYLDMASSQNQLKDQIYTMVKWMMRNLDPMYYLCKFMVKRIFVINSSIADIAGLDKTKTTVLAAVASDQPSIKKRHFGTDRFTALCVGRFHYMKGFDVAIRSFAHFYQGLSEQDQKRCTLKLVGKGPEETKLRVLIDSLNINSAVEIINWVDKSDMENIYATSDVFLFPSHEGAGMVIPEAQSFGLPTITFDNIGPGELAGTNALKVIYDSYEKSVLSFSGHLKRLFHCPKFRLLKSEQAYENFSQHFTWQSKAKRINEAYEELTQKRSIAVFHPSSELYGADRILVNALKALPTEVQKVVYLKFNGPLEQFLKQEVEGVQVKVIPFLPIIYRAIFTPKGVFQFLADWIRFAGFIASEKRAYGFKSAYVNTLSCSFISPILYVLRIRNFIHVHEIIESPKMIGRLTAYLGYLFSQKMVCVSNAVQENLMIYLPKLKAKSIVLHNGIEAITTANKTESKKVSFYLFGRIMRKKGQWFLLDALKLLPQHIKNEINIVLMGGAVPGKEEEVERLNAEIAKNDLNEIIQIKGFEKTISTAMEQADVCLVPSMMKDPFPTTVLEAMSAGKPVIATNHGGAKEALNGSNCGILVNPGSTEELANGISSMVLNRSKIKLMGSAAKDRFENNFTKQHFDQNWLSFNRQESFI